MRTCGDGDEHIALSVVRILMNIFSGRAERESENAQGSRTVAPFTANHCERRALPPPFTTPSCAKDRTLSRR